MKARRRGRRAFPPPRAPRRRLCVSFDDDPRHSGADTGSDRADGATERRSRRWRCGHWLRGRNNRIVARRVDRHGSAICRDCTHSGAVVVPGLHHPKPRPHRKACGARCREWRAWGIRSGEHVAAALAMGARSVFVGRPILWALAAAGQEGIEQVIKSLTEELRHVMVQLGVAGIDELAPDLLVTSAGRP
jgi:hypothetical protein